MNQPSESKGPGKGQYDSNYGNFQGQLYEEIRREAFGDDIGQNSWLTADELERFLGWLSLSAGRRVLDVACGAGGPALRMAATTGCAVTGVDVHEQAIATARSLAAQRDLASLAQFQLADASQKLPFDDCSFDAVTCIDAINHFQNRPGVIAEWTRLLRPGGQLLFTDPCIVTGALTNAEIAVRGSLGFYLFVPAGCDEGVLAQCSLKLVVSENRTGNMAEIAERRRAARASRGVALREIEGDQMFESQQEFLSITARTAQEGRLSRFVFVAEKPR